MRFKLFEKFTHRGPLFSEDYLLESRRVPLCFVRHPRARRYRVRLAADGRVRVTIPRGGSLSAARRFVESSRVWLERQFRQLDSQPSQPARWQIGSRVLFRGELLEIQSFRKGELRVGSESLPADETVPDLRPAIELWLRQLAMRELPSRVSQLARNHGLVVKGVTVRGQRTRWGSCSRRGTLSLNWRLIQTPGFVRDYVILHELAHLKQLNHSTRFWRQVEVLCPDFRDAERWLKQHRDLLH